MITIDIETWGLKPGYTLQPWRQKTNESGIMCVGLHDAEGMSCVHSQTYISMNYLDIIPTDIICGWNLKFDLSFLAHNFKEVFENRVFLDGMLLLKRMYANLDSYALKKVLQVFESRLDGVDVNYADDIEFKVGMPEECYTEKELKEMKEYCLRDCVYTDKLIRFLMLVARPEDIKCAIIDSTASFQFACSLYEGVNIDKKFLERALINNQSNQESLERDLEESGITSKMLRSAKQLREFMFEKDIELSERTERGEVSVSKGALVKAIREPENKYHIVMLQKILKLKSVMSERSKFLIGAKSAVLEDGTVHPQPFLMGTYTGRVTYSISQTISEKKLLKNGKEVIKRARVPVGVPIHQMKKGNIRNMLVAPAGHKVVEIDFCAQEMRLLACVSNETTMLEFFGAGKDLHAYTAARIHNIDYDEFQNLKKTDQVIYDRMRKVGKVTNLALQYRLSAPMLLEHWHVAHKLWDKTLNDAVGAKNTYLTIYPAIPRYWEHATTKAKHLGYAENMAGRQYPLDFSDGWKDSQTAINFPIQSTGAEQKMLALYCLRKILSKYGIKFAWDLHDGLYFYVKDDETFHAAVSSMARCIGNLNYKKAWGWEPLIKFPVEVKVGDSWGDLKEYSIL